MPNNPPRKLSVSLRSKINFVTDKVKKAENVVAAFLHRQLGRSDAEKIDEKTTNMAVEMMFHEETVDITFVYHKDKAFAVPGLPPRVQLAPRPLLPIEAQPEDFLGFKEEFIVIPVFVKKADEIIRKVGRDIALTRYVCDPAKIEWPEWDLKKALNPIH